MTSVTPKLDIEELKKRYRELDAKRIAAKANLETAEKRLAELKQEAREKWQTDDLDELKLKLEKMKEDNEAKRDAYQQHVEHIQSRLAQVEAQFAESRAGSK